MKRLPSIPGIKQRGLAVWNLVGNFVLLMSPPPELKKINNCKVTRRECASLFVADDVKHFLLFFVSKRQWWSVSFSLSLFSFCFVPMFCTSGNVWVSLGSVWVDLLKPAHQAEWRVVLITEQGCLGSLSREKEKKLTAEAAHRQLTSNLPYLKC